MTGDGPTDSRGGPHHVCGVALCSMWHFALRGWILEVAPTDSRGGPHHVCGVALCSMWHLVPFRITGHCIYYRITRQDSRKRDNHKVKYIMQGVK